MYDRVSALRRSAYTGENRCWPCTLVNVVVLAAVCGALVFAWPPLSVVVGVAGVATIWLRGYLLPYTPRFAPQLVDRLPVDPFHSDGDREPGSLADPGEETDGEAVLESLLEAGVLEPAGEDLEVAAAFRDRWDEEMATLRDRETEALADAALEATPAASDAEAVYQGGREYVVLSDGSDDVAAESWLRRPTAIAEVAAVRAQAGMGVPRDRRVAAANALCMFLSACPDCGGPVEELVAGGCCGPPPTTADGEPRTAMVCTECGAHLHVFE